ncbi:MAG TPA: hypothetical protein VE622_04905 [Nitrososphaeraceae archaeon]|jgi:hypothetical protein|nr:hypothetical protein [Nitrososphaeraceae archaeon]
MAKKAAMDKSSITSARKLKSAYQDLLQEAARLFPKVDQKLLLNILQFETTYKDWEGSVMLKLIYPAGKIDLYTKKDWIYKKLGRVPDIEEDRMLRFKAIRMYIEGLEELLIEDPEIEYITGSATLAPSDAYAA